MVHDLEYASKGSNKEEDIQKRIWFAECTVD